MMMTEECSMQFRALKFLYKQMKAAKVALGRAEYKPRSGKEIESLQNKIELLDWIIEVVRKEIDHVLL